MKSCEDFPAEANKRITIQSPLDADDGYGGRSRTWSDVGEYWAAIYPISGREYFAQQGLQSGITHKMMIRYQSGFKDVTQIADYRVSFDGRIFAVKYLKNLDSDLTREGRDFQVLFVEENAPDASTS